MWKKRSLSRYRLLKRIRKRVDSAHLENTFYVTSHISKHLIFTYCTQKYIPIKWITLAHNRNYSSLYFVNYSPHLKLTVTEVSCPNEFSCHVPVFCTISFYMQINWASCKVEVMLQLRQKEIKFAPEFLLQIPTPNFHRNPSSSFGDQICGQINKRGLPI